MPGSEKMRVVLEARALAMKGGVNTYVRQLIAHLAPRMSGEMALLVDELHDFAMTHNLPQEVVSLPHPALLSWWMNYSVPKRLRRLKPNLVHYTKAHIPARREFPTVVTIHDVIPLFLPETQAWMARMFWPQALAHAAKESDHIITMSNRSKQDIINHFQIDPVKITVIPLAAEVAFFESAQAQSKQALATQLDVPYPYILFVGTRDIRKNISGLIRAFEAIASDIPHSLVIAGKPALKQDSSQALAASSRFASRIKFIDFVPLDQLPVLYRGADLFVWPSIYEGWGLPPQEAMAASVPVIVSDGGSLPEVVQGGGEVVPFSPGPVTGRLEDRGFEKELASRMKLVLSDKSRAEALVTAGRQQLTKFSWDTVATSTHQVYKDVLARI